MKKMSSHEIRQRFLDFLSLKDIRLNQVLHLSLMMIQVYYGSIVGLQR